MEEDILKDLYAEEKLKELTCPTMSNVKVLRTSLLRERQEVIKLKKQKNFLNYELKETKGRNKNLEKQMEEYEEERGKLTEQKDRLNALNEELREKLNKKDKEFARVKERVSRLSNYAMDLYLRHNAFLNDVGEQFHTIFSPMQGYYLTQNQIEKLSLVKKSYKNWIENERGSIISPNKLYYDPLVEHFNWKGRRSKYLNMSRLKWKEMVKEALKYVKEGMKLKEAEKHFGISARTISRIAKREIIPLKRGRPKRF